MFKHVEWVTPGQLKTKLDPAVIPTELGGDLVSNIKMLPWCYSSAKLLSYVVTYNPQDSTLMDSWLNKRLKFEVFWEDCRNSYERLQYLPASLKDIAKQVGYIWAEFTETTTGT